REPRQTKGRRINMRQQLLIAALVAMTVAACGDPSRAGDLPNDSDSAELMATALRHLVSEDHTFGQGPPPFTEYLIEDRTVDNAAVTSPEEDVDPAESRALTERERAAVEEAISEYGPVRWVTDPSEWRTADLQPVIEGSVIIGVGIPRLDGEGALVPVSLWCGGLCGTWLTYRLELDDVGTWQVTGTEGPIAIS
ncbi:MAG: hypothetical protein WD990_10545, partial [Acidimicrobiia bacterium]